MRTFTKVLLTFCLFQVVYAGEAAINLDQATSKIIRQQNGKVLGARTESFEGKVIHVIKILTVDGRIQHIKIDAETGQIFK